MSQDFLAVRYAAEVLRDDLDVHGFAGHFCEHEIDAYANGSLLTVREQIRDGEWPIHAAIAERFADVRRVLDARDDLDVARAGHANRARGCDLGKEILVDLRQSGRNRFVGAKRFADTLRPGVKECALHISGGGILDLDGGGEVAARNRAGDDGDDDFTRGCSRSAQKKRRGDEAKHGRWGPERGRRSRRADRSQLERIRVCAASRVRSGRCAKWSPRRRNVVAPSSEG